MGVTKKVIQPGNGVDKPKAGQKVTIQYTGNLYDETAGAEQDFRGAEYDQR